MPDPDEVARLISRTAQRIEGVAAIGRPVPSLRSWRLPATVPGCASTPPADVVATAGGRSVSVERRRRMMIGSKIIRPEP